MKGSGIALASGLSHPLERRLVDRFVCVSQAVAEGNGLVRRGLPYEVIPNFIHDDPEPRPPNADALLAQLPYSNWPHSVVMEAWDRSLFELAPSTWPEPFGTILLEAMVTSRPIVASRTGGMRDIVVDGETGILVPPGDVRGLQQAVARLIADPSLRDRMRGGVAPCYRAPASSGTEGRAIGYPNEVACSSPPDWP